LGKEGKNVLRQANEGYVYVVTRMRTGKARSRRIGTYAQSNEKKKILKKKRKEDEIGGRGERRDSSIKG